MEFGGAPGDAQYGRDLLGRTPLGDELQDFPLAVREFIQGLGTPGAPAPYGVEEFPGYLGCNERSPPEGLPDGRNQLGRGGVLRTKPDAPASIARAA